MALDIISRLPAETVLITGLPVEIALDIISRLPAETILICKLVSKTWHNYLTNTDRKNFAKMHLKQLNRLHQHDNKNSNNGRSKVSLGFIFLLKSENEKPSGYPLFYGEYYTKQGTVQKTPRLINHPLIPAKQKHYTDVLVGSCNGLICFAEPTDYVRDPVHICNPIARECLSLQEFKESLQGFREKYNYPYKKAWRVRSGFGNSPQTNKYKVVRIIYLTTNFHERFGHVQVYTLGSGTGWRNKGIVNHLFDSNYGVFAYGALHWVVSKEKKIMAFDLSDENFHEIPEGPFSNPICDKFSFLRSWGGQQLYGVETIKNKCFDIWSFKNTSSDESIINAATTAASAYNDYKSWSWCKEFSITIHSSYAPFAVTRNGLVVSSDRSTIYYYNPQKQSITSLATLDNPLEVIPHTNSFVSLKDLGETTCKKRKKRNSSSGAKKNKAS